MDINFLLALGAKDVILTPNQRLANTLQQALEKHYIAQNRHAFIPPILLSFSQFIRLLWKSYIFITPKKLLSNTEEKWLWQNIITQSKIGKELLNTQQASTLVQSAWHHLVQWRLSPNDFLLETHSNDNLHYFTLWANDFIALCSQRHFIDESSALTLCSANTSFLDALPYQKFYFYHFIEMTPLQDHFTAALRQQQKTVIIFTQPKMNRDVFRFEAETPHAEIQAMATWAKEHHAYDATLKIGCVIPTLHQRRNEVLRIFKTVFNSETPAIDISAGYLLTEYAIIQHMMLLITLFNDSFDYEIFSTYLRSAYFGNSEEGMLSQHLLDIALRRKCSKTTCLTQIVSVINTYPQINNLLAQSKITRQPAQTLSLWCQQWLALLAEQGWPGQRNLNSTDYQVVQRFMTLMQELEDFCTLQFHWTWHEFSSLLKTQCQQIIFQPEVKKTSIQILGLLEASGMIFDHLWVMGLEDKTWPSTPSPNPFLPYSLQKECHMPHASAEREYAFCQHLQTNFIENSTFVIFSSARYDQDQILNSSPLIRTIPLHPFLTVIAPAAHNASIDLEHLSDDIAPAVALHEKITGGTAIIQQQALCPFKAFATIRLHARQIPEPLDAPNALIRGHRIHRILELFWRETKTSANLLQLTLQELENRVKTSITQTYAEINAVEDFFTTLEKIRLKKLMHAWLELEKQRPAFSVIALEQTREYRYKNIILRMRIDRIDEVENGQHVIIDYKTGPSNIQHWLGSRIKQPQLPIYCISHPVTTSTLCFAQLRWNDLCIKGITDDGQYQISTITAFEKLSPEMRAPTWPEQKIQWKNNIDQLLEDFLHGAAAVDPLDSTTCTLCDLTPLCRIFEKNR